MSLNFVLLLLVSLEVKLAISLNCQPPHNCENVTRKNNTQVIETMNCGPSNISCGYAKVCREGLCVDVEPSTPDDGGLFSSKMPYRTEEVEIRTIPRRQPSTTESSHSLISGNQEFAIALVGFSILFINFCLVSFCLARMKRRRLQQRCTAATQSSQTEDVWNEDHVTRNDPSQPRSEILNMGIENFALNGDMDAFSDESLFPQVRLPPYDFSSAYHKPRPRSGELEEDGGEPGESGDAAAFDTQSIGNEDPPPYCDQRFDSSACGPPSYDEALKVLETDVEESTSGL